MNAKHAFKPVVADTTLETRVVLSTIAPRAAIGVVNTPVFFNPTHNTVNLNSPRSPIAFATATPPRLNAVDPTTPTNSSANTPSFFSPTQNQVNPSNPRAPIPFGGFFHHPPVTGGSGFAGSGANSGTGVGRGNGLFL